MRGGYVSGKIYSSLHLHFFIIHESSPVFLDANFVTRLVSNPRRSWRDKSIVPNGPAGQVMRTGPVGRCQLVLTTRPA